MDVALKGDPAAGLRSLSDALSERLNGKEAELDKRRARHAAAHDQQRKEWKQAGEAAGKEKPIDYRWVSCCINEVFDEDTVLVNEYDLLPQHVDSPVPPRSSAPPTRQDWDGGSARPSGSSWPSPKRPSSLASATAATCSTRPRPRTLSPARRTCPF